MRRKKILILPILRDRRGDVSKQWFVEVSQRDPRTDKMERARFQLYNNISINSLSTAIERYTHAEKIIKELEERLASGWTIFNRVEERVVYEDQTQYRHEARLYKKAVESNKNYAYWCSRYFTEVLRQKGLKHDSLITYESRYRVFKNWLVAQGLERLDIVAITHTIMYSFFTYLRDQCNHTKHTANSYAGLLFDLFDWVIKQKGMYENPVHDLPVNKTIKDMGAEALHRDDLLRIIAAMDNKDPQLALACRFEYYCGLRPGKELRLLKINEIDLQRGIVHIPAERNKSNRRKEVAVPDVFLDYLINVWKLQNCAPNMYLFGRYGEPGWLHLGKNTLRERFNRFRDALKLPDIYKFYSLKHTGAVALAEQGETIINIRDHLGHVSIQTTEHYLNRLGVNKSKIIKHNFPAI